MNEIVLSKSSSSDELKRYFMAILQLSESGNEFPINLDEVWVLVYQRRDVAVRALTKDFMEGVDYQILRKNVEQDSSKSWGGNNKVTYMLTVSCMEFFIARKVRAVFEVYRQVFHKAANGAIPSYQIADPIKRAERWIEEQKQLQTAKEKIKELVPKADFADQIFRVDSAISIGTCGKVLGLPFGSKTLFKKLREHGVLFKNSTEAKQKYIDAGYFVVNPYYVHTDSVDFMKTVTRATQKRLAYIGYLFGMKPNKDEAARMFALGQAIDRQENKCITD